MNKPELPELSAFEFDYGYIGQNYQKYVVEYLKWLTEELEQLKDKYERNSAYLNTLKIEPAQSKLADVIKGAFPTYITFQDKEIYEKQAEAVKSFILSKLPKTIYWATGKNLDDSNEKLARANGYNECLSEIKRIVESL